MKKELEALEIIKERTSLTMTTDGEKALVFVILETQEGFNEVKEFLEK